MSCCQPVLSDVADLFWWKTTKTIASNSPINSANVATDQVKLLPNAFFCFVAWRGSTNYDSVTQLRASIGAGPASATGLYPAAIPNNFEAMVKRNNRFSMMDQPMPQAALCSSGYRAGQQVPIPILYPPATTFNFTLFNTAETLFLNAAGAAIDLRIDFGLFGYNVLSSNLSIFTNSWPALYAKAMKTLTGIAPRLNT
jgi:hypothetical protein